MRLGSRLRLCVVTQSRWVHACIHVHGGPRICLSVCVHGGGREREEDRESGTRASERDDERVSQSGIHLCVRACNVWFNAATLPHSMRETLNIDMGNDRAMWFSPISPRERGLDAICGCIRADRSFVALPHGSSRCRRNVLYRVLYAIVNIIVDSRCNSIGHRAINASHHWY